MWKILIIGIGFMSEDGKEIKFKEYKEAQEFMNAIKGCELLCGHEIQIIKEE
jgi:hypothetical protein